MKNITRISIAFGFAALLPLTTLSAQPDFSADAPLVQERRPSDPSTIEARWAEAERLYGEGHLRESLREYAEIAKIQEDYHLNAADTFWRIAEIQNALGDQLKMARALDSVAREAERAGKVDLQIRALREAAAGYRAIRQFGLANARMQRLQTLGS